MRTRWLSLSNASLQSRNWLECLWHNCASRLYPSARGWNKCITSVTEKKCTLHAHFTTLIPECSLRSRSLKIMRHLQSQQILWSPIRRIIYGVFQTIKSPTRTSLLLLTWRICRRMAVRCDSLECTCISFAATCSRDRGTRGFPKEVEVQEGARQDSFPIEKREIRHRYLKSNRFHINTECCWYFQSLLCGRTSKHSNVAEEVNHLCCMESSLEPFLT